MLVVYIIEIRQNLDRSDILNLTINKSRE